MFQDVTTSIEFCVHSVYIDASLWTGLMAEGEWLQLSDDMTEED